MTHFPGWEERQITVPEGFEFDLKRLSGVEGLVASSSSTAHTGRQPDTWLREARGQLGQ